MIDAIDNSPNTLTVQEYAGEQTERIAQSLGFFLDSTPADKLRWQPEVEGQAEGGAKTRSIFQLVGECVSVNLFFAAVMRAESPVRPAGGWHEPDFTDVEDAKTQLYASSLVLCQAIRALPDSDLSREFQHPRGLVTGKKLILAPYRNMAYHAGQINFIQTLYGDAEFHFPPTWL